jgi:alanyl-tRNA synthetase
MLNDEMNVISGVANTLKTNVSAVLKRAEDVANELKSSKKEIADLKAKSAGDVVGELIASAKEIGGKKVITKVFDGVEVEQLRTISDKVKESAKNVVMIFATKSEDGKTTLLSSVSDDLLDKGVHAGKLIKEVAAVCGGGGGGKADMAQAGAKDASKLEEAFAKAEELLK